MKVALFDLDDTLINTKDAIYYHLRDRYNMEVNHWSLWGSFRIEEHSNIDQQEFMDLCNRDKLFMQIKPYLFATQILKDLRMHGYHVLLVTAREGFIYDDPVGMTEQYLKENDLEYDNLIVSESGGDKVKHLTNYDHIEFSLDDQVHNCDAFAACGKIDHVLLAAEAHNKNCTLYPRLHNLYQVYNYIGLDK